MYSITPCHKDGFSKGTHTGRNVRPLTEDLLLNHTKYFLEAYQHDPFFSSGEYSRGYTRDMSGCWMLCDKVVVLKDSDLRTWNLQLCHALLLSGHSSISKTVHLVAKKFHRPGIRAEIEQSVHPL